jgi:Branched-chain amino acid transport system / permease component
MPPEHRPSLGPLLDPDGCLARSIIRTQPSTEETGAVRTRELEETNETDWQLGLPKKTGFALDGGPANGCHRNHVTTVAFLQFATPLGVRVAAIGDNERAAYLSGQRVWQTKLAIYALSSFGASVAGIILSSQVHTAAATYGEFGTELDVIASVVLGGTSLSGGRGSVVRTVLGVLFLGVMNSGMAILNVPIDGQLIAKGILIALALAAAQLQ